MLLLRTMLVVMSTNALILLIEARFDFTNAICISENKPKVNLDYCVLKAVNRTYKYFSLRVKFYKYEPTNIVKVVFILLKKANGYKPFLYNVTVDGCKYLRNRSNPVFRYIHSWFEEYSNMNHTCPYGLEDIIVEHLPISHVNNLVTNVLPVPPGEYQFLSKWYREDVLWATVKVYGTLT